MRAIQYDFADPAFPASLVELDEPALPRGDWARVEVSACGIRGSDLHLFSDNIGDTPALAPLAPAFPFVLGHEIYFHLGGLDLYPETLKSAHSKA